ncbi:hypothetical protein DFR30_2846 [Thiogranum longum]|uniref:Lipoprotein n=1 Tax=Thiogranum longum TaxID=1537524 RepID=A0A4R1HFP9_9GAMM|nr:hypothetical protein [Thiogranum longum]TCK19533.1 hypothetical protein DFR30_2846 [Thiogranum longum]
MTRESLPARGLGLLERAPVILNIISLLVLLLAGCSSVAVRNPVKMSGNDNKVVINYCIKSSARMNIIDKTLSSEENRRLFERNIEAAVEDIHDYVDSNALELPFFKFSELPTCNLALQSVTPDASLFLTLELSGYGSIKEKWKKVLIGTGAIEAVVQGVVVGSATQNVWLGLGVAAEEMTSEYLTWNGVDWVLGETFAPVTLEGRMITIKTRKVVWEDSYFVAKNNDELRKLGKEEKADKTRQLEASLHKVERKLISRLNDYLAKDVLQKPLGSPP